MKLHDRDDSGAPENWAFRHRSCPIRKYMRKMMIGGVPHLWKALSFTNPSGTVSLSIIVAYAENDPHAEPVYLIDNNGTDPFGRMGHAVWLPTNEVHFHELKEGEKVTW